MSKWGRRLDSKLPERKKMNLQKSIRLVALMMMMLSLTVASRAQGRRDEDRWQQLGRSNAKAASCLEQLGYLGESHQALRRRTESSTKPRSNTRLQTIAA